MYLSIGMLPLIIGFAASILYPETTQGDPQLALPNMVLVHAPIGLQILFFGALLSAILSTSSGAMLAPAAIIGENIVKFFRPDITDQKLLRVMRLGVIGVAAVSAIMAMGSNSIYELVAQSSSLSLVSLFIPLAAGLYWKRASHLGALLSMSFGFSFWILLELQAGLGAQPLIEGPSIIWGGLASCLGMIAGSLIQKGEPLAQATK
jgi:Na+/proline symporter